MQCWMCRVSGQQSQPVVEGSAQLRKASIYCPHLKYPMTNVHADIHMANNRLQVDMTGIALLPCLGQQQCYALRATVSCTGIQHISRTVYELCTRHSTTTLPASMPCTGIQHISRENLWLCVSHISGLAQPECRATSSQAGKPVHVYLAERNAMYTRVLRGFGSKGKPINCALTRILLRGAHKDTSGTLGSATADRQLQRDRPESYYAALLSCASAICPMKRSML